MTAQIPAPSSVEALVRELASFDSHGLPVVTAYLDNRPEAVVGEPRRPGHVVLKDRLSELRKTLGKRGPDVDSFTADAERIQAFVTEEADPAAEGLAVFACHGAGLFEHVEAGAPFENQVTMGPRPDLFQLLRLLDEYETAVIILADTRIVRVFVERLGSVQEAHVEKDKIPAPQRVKSGALRQKHIQRHVDEDHKEFAKQAARAIERVVDDEGATRVILAGDEVVVPFLERELHQRVKDRFVSDPIHIDIRANRNDVTEEVRDILARAEESENRSMVEEALNRIRADGAAVAGLDAVRQAFEMAQVDTLIIPSDLDEQTRAELSAMAAQTRARVEVVEPTLALAELGNVAALLRYKF